MKKDAQIEIVDDLLPEIKDEEVIRKVNRIFELHEAAKEYRKAREKVKEQISGFVLNLNKEDQDVGRLRIGDYVMLFTIKKTEVKIVEYETKAGKKVRLKFAPEKDGEE